MERVPVTNKKNNRMFFRLISTFSNDQLKNRIVELTWLNSLLDVERFFLDIISGLKNLHSTEPCLALRKREISLIYERTNFDVNF